MLVNLYRDARNRLDKDDPESGVALVVVVVVMLVGFVIASTIAATVLFTIQSNQGNKSRTQAFIAAESGRDKVVSQVVAGCSGPSSLRASGATPAFTANAKFTTSATQPTNYADAGLSATCPGTSAGWLVIRSTGTGPDGSTSTIDSVYPWQVRYSDVPGGVVTFFSGSVTSGVAHYTGDLVLRDGDWSCNIDGILDGDLYVLTGTASLANNCTINGDIWANGNVDGSSTGWKIKARAGSTSTGSITTNGTVHLRSTGSTSVEGKVSAKGNITLDGNTDPGTIGGTVTSKGAVSKGSQWTTGTVTQNSPSDPVFEPTLAWLMAATQWIDLNATSSWGTREPTQCTINSAGLLSLMATTSATPLVIDLTTCPSTGRNASPLFTGGNPKIDISTVTVRRDVVILAPAGKKLSVNLTGTVSDDGNKHQVYFVHVDTVANHLPTCGNGSTQDQFDASGVVDPNLRLMVYAPCGLGGTVNANFSGQLYADDTTHFISSAIYTCKAMSWGTVLPKLGCTIKGPGGVVDDSTLTQSLGDLAYQSEQ